MILFWFIEDQGFYLFENFFGGFEFLNLAEGDV
jgi:hypothetical protein